MASLWIQTKSAKAPQKILGHLSMSAAQIHLTAFVDRYLQEKAGRSVRWVSGLDAVMLDSKGGVFANVYVEPISPPTIPDPGDKRRTAMQGDA